MIWATNEIIICIGKKNPSVSLRPPGLPLALEKLNGRLNTARGGNVLREDNPDNLEQFIRQLGQQEETETELYYNRYRYLDPLQGRYK